MVFLVVENENRQLEDLPQADFGRVHEKNSFVGKEKVKLGFNSIPRDYNSLYSLSRYFTGSLLSLTR